MLLILWHDDERITWQFDTHITRIMFLFLFVFHKTTYIVIGILKIMSCALHF